VRWDDRLDDKMTQHLLIALRKHAPRKSVRRFVLNRR
jgi:hypothetical protein